MKLLKFLLTIIFIPVLYYGALFLPSFLLGTFGTTLAFIIGIGLPLIFLLVLFPYMLLVILYCIVIAPLAIWGPNWLPKSVTSFVYTTSAFSKELERSRPFSPRGFVRIKNGAGDITVKGWDQDEIHVTALKRAETLESLDGTRAVIELNAGSAEIKTEFERNIVRGAIDYTVYVPHAVTLEKLDTGSGTVVVNGVHGSIDVQTNSGSLSLHDVHNNVVAKANSGNIYIEQAHDVRGKVKVSNHTGQTVLVNMHDDVTVKSYSGSIQVTQVALADDVELELITKTGSVDLGLPRKANATIDAETETGNILSDMTIGKSQVRNAKDVRGTIGSGGAFVKLRSKTGNITIQ